MKISILCPVYPTEDETLILKALDNLFPGVPFQLDDDSAHTATEDSHDLAFLRTRIFEQRIIDATRSRLLANLSDLSTQLIIDKQAALFGRVRVIDDSEEIPPLGAIEIRFSFNDEVDFTNFLSWFTPPTVDGQIVS